MALGRRKQGGTVYRYRTRTLTGPWQPTLGAAVDDAIKAGLARVDPAGEVHWAADAGIEQAPPADQPVRSPA